MLKSSENRSVKSSDNSSSGNQSDQELLSSSKSNKSDTKKRQIQHQHIYAQSNYYELNKISNSKLLQQQQQQQQPPKSTRSIDQMPKDLRLSKQSFIQAMQAENQCEFFVDAM